MTGPKRPLLDTAAAASQQRKRRRTSGCSARAEAGTSHQQHQEQQEDAGQDDQVPDNLLLPAAGLLQPAPLQAGGLALASLPQLVLATILDLLSVGDVVRLSQVDRLGAYTVTCYIYCDSNIYSDMVSIICNIYNSLYNGQVPAAVCPLPLHPPRDAGSRGGYIASLSLIQPPANTQPEVGSNILFYFIIYVSLVIFHIDI